MVLNGMIAIIPGIQSGLNLENKYWLVIVIPYYNYLSGFNDAAAHHNPAI